MSTTTAANTPRRSPAKQTLRAWLDNEVTAKFATGTYVAPEAGRVTVGDVYESWSASQAHISRQDGGDPQERMGQPGRTALG